MIEFIFTLDYEIYGNGSGSLQDLVLDPTQRLAEIFEEFDAPMVIFVEAVEFPKIEEAQSDSGSAGVRDQLRQLRAGGHEIALHLHPWWANARFEDGFWKLDWSERNLGELEEKRVEEIVSNAIEYLRKALNDPSFMPVAFRSGLWAMQPTCAIATVLAQNGLRVDSSVFKGGRIGSLGLDYRPALRNENIWCFRQDINKPDPDGILWEMPIHVELVPFWKMLGSKRLRLQDKARTPNASSPLPRRWGDFLRFRYPRKLDFCRMTFNELCGAMEPVIQDARTRPQERRRVVAIGHSKDFVDSETLRRFLEYLQDRSVVTTTFARVFCEELQPLC